MKVCHIDKVHFLDTSFPTLPSLSGELLGWGWVVKTTVWAITAFITAFLVTLQANAMWKRLIHGSQVLNTATPPAVAVIPPAVCDPQQLPSPFPPQAPLSGVKGGGRRRKGGGCDYLGVKDRMWATKGEFFEPTSFQSTICAWTATEFKQRRQTKHRYREVHAGFYKNSHDREKGSRGRTNMPCSDTDGI